MHARTDARAAAESPVAPAVGRRSFRPWDGLAGAIAFLTIVPVPAVAVLPIGDNFTMGPKHAALAAKYLGAKTVIPVHHGTFPALTGTPAELKTHLEGSGIAVVAPRPGESVE